MKKNSLLLSCFLLCATLNSCSRGGDDAPDETQRLRILNAVDSVRAVLEERNHFQVPSLNVLIETPKGKYFVSAATNKRAAAVTEDTYYRFASVTKNFTATAILYMQQMEWLNIEDKITAPIPDLIPGSHSNVPYVPDNENWAFPHKGDISIKQLLQHSAGVYDIDNDSVPDCNGASYTDYVLNRDPMHQFSSSELVKVLVQHRLSYWAPGTNYHYSNTGYTILGEIVARVYTQQSGVNKTYDDFLREKIYGRANLVPLNIQFVSQATDRQLPEPYVKGMIVTKEKIEILDLVNASHHVAEGNGIGTMAELNKYIRSLMKGQNVLTHSTIAAMQHTTGPQSGNPYALGCTKFSNLGYGHNGASSGYLNMVCYDPETDISLVVMMPAWDLQQGARSLAQCLEALMEAGWAARKALGYPGKP